MQPSTLFLLGLLSHVWQIQSAAISRSRTASLNTLARRSNAGSATFYGGNVAGGHCSFANYQLPQGVYGTAFANWDNSEYCGACVKVTGPAGNQITAQIVDECPGCVLNHLDLFPDAFKALADPSKGNITVSWDFVTCPIDTPFTLVQKSGVSAFWFSMQVVGNNKEVKSLAVSKDGGKTYEEASRKVYNFFEIANGVGAGPITVKVTAADGEEVITDDVPIGSDESTPACSNFAVD